MGRRTSKFKLKKPNTSFALNINSMTDMFTIMLVFLLQTYSTNPFEVKPQNNLRLPSSSVDKSPDEAIDISINSSVLKFKDLSLTTLKDGKFDTSQLDPQDQEVIKPLLDKLTAVAKENENSTDPNKKKGELILQADRSLSYGTLKKVMYTASAAGFPKVKLAVVVGNQ